MLMSQTIIECLKYATTGELPPNSDRGKSFIHDPNVRVPPSLGSMALTLPTAVRREGGLGPGQDVFQIYIRRQNGFHPQSADDGEEKRKSL